jgi:hypothetical protein
MPAPNPVEGSNAGKAAAVLFVGLLLIVLSTAFCDQPKGVTPHDPRPTATAGR